MPTLLHGASSALLQHPTTLGGGGIHPSVQYANHVMPAVDGNLTGDDEGAGVVAVLDNFQEVAPWSALSASGPQSSRISNLGGR